ncbi:carboxypeptidase regulatory-like domain-containing protein [Infirmifilum lucidum]|uniref:Carboxypeptidase regulatory-like domain-containing protein n=1 Tax=Infirmifilum lucidum TaxID=2776706 RepID=A0A7L9FID5_9CREN|nr:carboxypeptidase regulatory-like domain-containing protein [Infirmifilum lucidum]QOJ79598.1 carboxypeptidase regulatory-like domain-containing protein [Infirmifilum lucidum]
MSNKYLLGVLALAILALALAYTAQAVPVNPNTQYEKLQTPWGTPFANQNVIIVIFNETGNCLIAYAQGTTDANGKILLKITSPTPLDTGQTGKFNISVFWLAYGKTFLVNTTRYTSTTVGNLFNQTIKLTYLWNFSFQALTNIAGQDVPLYYKDPESGREDKAYFEVRLDPNGPIVFSDYGDSGGKTAKTFLVGAIQVDIKPTLAPNCYHIESYWNTTFYKDIYWMLTGGPTPLKVKVGSETLNFSITDFNLASNGSATGAKLVITENVPGKPSTTVTLNLPGEQETIGDKAYTFLAIVTVNDFCNNRLTGWEWPPISVEFVSPSLGKLRVGKVDPTNGTAPEEGYKYQGRMYFWLPNTTLFYNEKQTLNIEINGIQVFTWAINTTKLANETLTIGGTKYKVINATKIAPQVWNFTVRVSVVKVQAVVKDSGVTAVQPLEGAMVVLQAPGYDPINTYTDGAGYIRFPPFTIAAGGSTQGGTPVITRTGSSPGYLPVPFTFATTGKLYTYTVKIYYALPGTEVFVDVTPDNNKMDLNLTKYITTCGVQSFTFIAKVYNVNIKAIDLCNRPITSVDDPNATLILTYTPPADTPVTFSVGLGKDGYVFLGKVPGGNFTVKLAFKGVLMDPISGPTPLTVTGNIVNASAATYTFPVGDIKLKVVQWDDKSPLVNISVYLDFYKGALRTYHMEGVSDCNGLVTFEKIPLKVDPAINSIIVTLKTRLDTPYIRKPKDVGLVVGKWDLTKVIAGQAPACVLGPLEVPAWIFSFTLEAVDHNGNVLTELPTSNGTAPVIVALNDTYTATEHNVTLVCITGPGCLCWPNIEVTYKIFNATGNPGTPWGNGMSKAVFRFTGTQWDNSKYPHLFIAGAKYSFIVWYSGVVVYNYNFTLPAPSEPLDYSKVISSQVILFNETTGEQTLVETDKLDYTWILDAQGRTEHPIVRFYGAPFGAGRYSIRLQLVTWVVNLDVYTVSKLGAGLVPGLNLTLGRWDALNWSTLLAGGYDTIVKPTGLTWGVLAWSAVDGNGDGVISIPVAIWMPNHKVAGTWVKFGTGIGGLVVLAGKKYGTPNVPDTPLSFTNLFTFYGYVVGPYNITLDSFTPSSWEASPAWYKFYGGKWVGPFRGSNVDYMLGNGWNVTYWSGAAKVVYTTAMEGFCVQVFGKDIRDRTVALANQPVTAVAVGTTGATSTLSTVYTDSDGKAGFYPSKGATVATPVGSLPVFTGNLAFLGISGLRYTLSTQLNFDDVLKPYGLRTTDVMDPDTLTSTVAFTLANNMPGGACVPLVWDAIKVTVFDWSGKPLQNAMVAAVLRSPRAKAIPSVIGFTDANGNVVLLVPPAGTPPDTHTQKYQLLVYWRDSYLLRAAGKIPKEIVIFDTYTDYDRPRDYAPGEGTTLETFVYVAKLVLRNAQGGALSPAILDKITVTVTWPDSVVTQDKPATDGSVILRLAKDIVKSWPFDPSSKYSPETPADHGQAPHGAYQVSVDLAGVGTVAKQSIKIEKGRFETSLQVFEVRLDIYDVKLTFTTPFGTSMASATVTITTPDGRKITDALDSTGSITVREVPPGKISFSVDSWKGIPVAYTGSVDRQPAVGITVPKIGKLTVKVLGARGQGIEGATVAVEKVGTFTTDASGVVTMEIPEGTYAITAGKGGRTASATATVTGGKEAVVELKLDIFLTIAGWEMSSSEFLGLILLLVLLVLVIFIIAHEYSVYRRRRLAKVIAPAEAGTQVR